MKYISVDAFVAWLKRIPIKDLSDGAGLCRIIMADDFERAIKELPNDIIYDTKYCPNCGKRLYDNIIQIPMTNRRLGLRDVAEKWLGSIASFIRCAKKSNGHSS